MRIAIVDISPESRAALIGRLQLACTEAGLLSPEILEVNLNAPGDLPINPPVACFIGPGSYSRFGELIEEIRRITPDVPIALVLENEIYTSRGISLRKRFGVDVMPLGDIAQIAGFLLDCAERKKEAEGTLHSFVVGVAHLKGGVGATTLATSLAACWARNDFTAALVDFDDLSPEATLWSHAKPHHRDVTAEFLRRGEVSQERINELLVPVEGYDGKLVVVAQPLLYKEGFHFKADVLDNAPSASSFVTTLLDVLRKEIGIVVIDLARSWGVATFAALPLCDAVMLVTDDDGMSIRITLDTLERLRGESGDSGEFDFSKWNMVLNSYTGKLITPQVLAEEVDKLDIMPPEASLFTVPFSESGRQWGAPGKSFYDLAEPSVKEVIFKICSTLVPMEGKASEDQGALGKLVGKLKSFI
ncbi:MAG: hypothetical protein D6808_05890 [Candidatus Dadabacteria bacterium]|nr:MAG: hypothetical protein D6808_05890 [Candidatus Dadabacteria bacterium]